MDEFRRERTQAQELEEYEHTGREQEEDEEPGQARASLVNEEVPPLEAQPGKKTKKKRKSKMCPICKEIKARPDSHLQKAHKLKMKTPQYIEALRNVSFPCYFICNIIYFILHFKKRYYYLKSNNCLYFD